MKETRKAAITIDRQFKIGEVDERIHIYIDVQEFEGNLTAGIL
ncbi:hypothetical protein [Shouchella shacheensis]|nr:hypothetical protein [Shouchella shacheensis]